MKFITLFAGLPLLAVAAPTQLALGIPLQGDLCMPFQHDLRTPLQDGAFTAFASFEHEMNHPPIQARGLRFWLGGEPATYCPPVVEPHCPPGKVTAFSGGGYGLSVNVPGGQRVYVSPIGELGYTQAHSGYFPPGSFLSPFEYTPGIPFGHYTFDGKDFIACPNSKEDPTTWEVFAHIPNAIVPTGDIQDCLPFRAVTEVFGSPPAAWQYDI
ncbi:hypothetical protein V8E54_002049 [Elaphomyces granulatus]